MAKAAKKKSALAMIVFSQSRDIPFNRIFLSDSNVREINAEEGLDELTHDISRREDIVQGLNVRAVKDADGNETGDFETPAGGRRYRAIARLVEAGRFPADGLVPCLVDEKLQSLADEFASEGWKWISVSVELPYGHANGLRKLIGVTCSTSSAKVFTSSTSGTLPRRQDHSCPCHLLTRVIGSAIMYQHRGDRQSPHAASLP